MGRFLVDVPADDVRRLDQIARAESKSRTAVIREAVASYIAQGNKDWLEAGFGLWARYGFAEDGMDYQSRLRGEGMGETNPGRVPAAHGPQSNTNDSAA